MQWSTYFFPDRKENMALETQFKQAEQEKLKHTILHNKNLF